MAQAHACGVRALSASWLCRGRLRSGRTVRQLRVDAAAFALVKRAIGRREKMRRVQHLGIVLSQSGRNSDWPKAQLGADLTEKLLDSLNEDLGTKEIIIRQQHNELIAAVTCRKVHRASLGSQD